MDDDVQVNWCFFFQRVKLQDTLGTRPFIPLSQTDYSIYEGLSAVIFKQGAHADALLRYHLEECS